MKVYIVYLLSCGQWEIQNVFSSLSSAKNYIKKVRATGDSYYTETWIVEE